MDAPEKSVIQLSDRYINRELSWLEFNARVLEEARNPATPLLERIKFLAIFSGNLDEFFMVRVSGLLKMLQEGIHVSQSPDRMETRDVLASIRERTCELSQRQYKCLSKDLLPELEKNDIKITRYSDLTSAQKRDVDLYYSEQVDPVLTPLAFDPAHPFPFLSNQSMYLVVQPDIDLEHAEKQPLGFIEIPKILPRLIEVKTKTKGQFRFLLLEDLIAAHIPDIFFGFSAANCYTIRVTRNLDYNLLENEVSDLLKSIQREMIAREHQEIVRLEVEDGMPDSVLDVLKQQIGVSDDFIYKVPRPLHLVGLMQLTSLPMPELKEAPFNPRLHQSMASSDDIFSLISNEEILLHHPYDSFYSVVEFLMSAAHDPQVLAIKQTLYRTAGDSPVIDALIRAAENGKQVTAVVELKARFDEKNNIVWARRLENAGINVVFGFIGLKTHAKSTLIVRREKKKLVRYAHIATGNYNSQTAKLYTDIGYFTADPKVCKDVATMFNLVSGFNILTGEAKLQNSTKIPKLNRLSFSPITMRPTILELIRDEMESVRAHGSGLILGTMNALVDQTIIDQLYSASQAGVKIKLIVRGICCLRPGVKGLSENIEIYSIVDRFLEHMRIFWFQAKGKDKTYISSADWMPRNMDRRIEILCPVEHPASKKRLHDILLMMFRDNVKRRRMSADGKYTCIKPQAGEDVHRSQEEMIRSAREGGIKSIPYDIAIRHNAAKKRGKRPVAKKNKR